MDGPWTTAEGANSSAAPGGGGGANTQIKAARRAGVCRPKSLVDAKQSFLGCYKIISKNLGTWFA